jgi:hypothetical protein
MVAARIYMHKGFMRTTLRNLFSTNADNIGIVDYRENKDKLSTNIWMECDEDDIKWFLDEFQERYYGIYGDDSELTITYFKEGEFLSA